MTNLIDKLKDVKYFAGMLEKTHHSTDGLEFFVVTENTLDNLLKTTKNVVLIFKLPNSFKSEVIVSGNAKETLVKKVEQAKNLETPPFEEVFVIRNSTGNNFPTATANYIAALLASGEDSNYSFKDYEVVSKLSKQDKKLKSYIEKRLAQL